MLRFTYRMVKQFESGHGCRPNLLEISPEHFALLRQSLPLLSQHDDLDRFPGMRALFSRDAVHPRVAWSAIADVESA